MTLKIGAYEFDHVHYDADADVLYLSVGAPRPGTGEETPEGHIVRFDETGAFMGVTIIDARELAGRDDAVITLPSPEHVNTRDLGRALELA